MTKLMRALLVLAGAAAMIIPATSASASEPVQVGRARNCDEGPNVTRCAWFNYDPNPYPNQSLGRLRGYASVKDNTDGVDTIRVNVYLEAWNGSSWDVLASGSAGPSSSGTTGFTITGFTGLIPCQHLRTYRTRAVWFWNSSSGPVVSGTVHVC